jgi:alcohol dehydrogenase, propanol-preferring
MQAMVLKKVGDLLEFTDLADRQPGPGEIRVKVSACGVCRTDLHVVDGELPNPQVPIIPGHEIVGRIDVIGAGVAGLRVGERVGIPWLGHNCGVCPYCLGGQENLCDRPLFTGFTRDGGFATATIVDARYAFPLGEVGDDVALAPLLCAGLIGWRSLVIAGAGKKLGLYGFGAAAHIIAQVAKYQGRSVFAFTRPGDVRTQTFARGLGAAWAGGSDEMPPEPLDAAIIFAVVGDLVPLALQAIRKGGCVVCAGIHMSDIPSFPYRLALGRAATRVGCQSNATGWIGFPAPGPGDRHRHPYHDLSAPSGQSSPRRSPRRPVRRRGSSYAMSAGVECSAETGKNKVVRVFHFGQMPQGSTCKLVFKNPRFENGNNL